MEIIRNKCRKSKNRHCYGKYGWTGNCWSSSRLSIKNNDWPRYDTASYNARVNNFVSKWFTYWRNNYCFSSKLGAWIAKKRTPEVQKKYNEIGGGSPILKWTNKQGSLLCKELDRISPATAPHKHYVAFRYVPPFTEEAFDRLEK